MRSGVCGFHRHVMSEKLKDELMKNVWSLPIYCEDGGDAVMGIIEKRAEIAVKKRDWYKYAEVGREEDEWLKKMRERGVDGYAAEFAVLVGWNRSPFLLDGLLTIQGNCCGETTETI